MDIQEIEEGLMCPTNPTFRTPTIEYCGVRMTGDRIMEVEHGSVVNTAMRDGIGRILLRHGFQAQRPLVQVAVGGVVFAFGAFFVLKLIEIVAHGGPVIKYEGMFAGCVFLGGWLIWNGVQKGYYLEVTRGTSRAKFAFRGEAEAEGLEQFISRAANQFGYSVDHGPLT
ncbi:MAG TPA: hypothetical protein VK795_03800 [Terriglobales bacterium]|nr:hypothetical protein [Terriglobales bacterium]